MSDVVSVVLGSSPRMRGAPPQRMLPSDGPRIIPAYAGSTKRILIKNVVHLGSSPRMRGAP